MFLLVRILSRLLKTRLLVTAMFVPVQQVEKYFHEVIKQLVVREELATVLEYVERTWIGGS